MKKIKLIGGTTITLLSLSALPAYAVCPVCIVAVGAGLGLSQYLGIDDTISGVWIGGLTAAVAAWTINWFNKKQWNFGNKSWRDIITVLAYYAMVFWPLLSKDLIGNPTNKLYGVDKLALGAIFGSLVFSGLSLWYVNLKKNNNGHAYFPFQKVAMPFGGLAFLSLIFYWLTK
ncbi:MAG: hypothetical protein WCT50_04735 [Patescibacteria group bacterium]